MNSSWFICSQYVCQRYEDNYKQQEWMRIFLKNSSLYRYFPKCLSTTGKAIIIIIIIIIIILLLLLLLLFYLIFLFLLNPTISRNYKINYFTTSLLINYNQILSPSFHNMISLNTEIPQDLIIFIL